MGISALFLLVGGKINNARKIRTNEHTDFPKPILTLIKFVSVIKKFGRHEF